ncbi:unnamed protein product [Lampetra planeri]
MELKVWVDGLQRVVCGVSATTTCQEVVIVLAQAIGRAGRYALVERWKGSERALAPDERPLAALARWGQYAGDVTLALRRTGGPSPAQRPTSDGAGHVPAARRPPQERAFFCRQSLPPRAKFRPSPPSPPLSSTWERGRRGKRKSLTFTGGAPRLGEKESEESEVEEDEGGEGEKLLRLTRLQQRTVAALEARIEAVSSDVRHWERKLASELEEELEELEFEEGDDQAARQLEEQIARISREMDEVEEEVEVEDEGEVGERERSLRAGLSAVTEAALECDRRLAACAHRAGVLRAGIRHERQRRRRRRCRDDDDDDVDDIARLHRRISARIQEARRLEGALGAVQVSMQEANKCMQEKEQELELLNKELRQVNLQHFILQTGVKVSALPADTGDSHAGGHVGGRRVAGGGADPPRRPPPARPLPSNPRALQNPHYANPDGIYV